MVINLWLFNQGLGIMHKMSKFQEELRIKSKGNYGFTSTDL